MRRSAWQWFVVSSILVLSPAVSGETRPQYGGVLHVAVRAANMSLDPTDEAQSPSFAGRSLTLLLFDTLLSTDENGRIQPSLATSWQAIPGSQRWQFRIRRGVQFDDGTPFTAESAAASLRVSEPAWSVTAEGDSMTIEWDGAEFDLLAELSLPRNAIAKRTVDNKLSGTGPFHVSDWQPGRRLTMTAQDGYWRGRPFVDSIEIEMGKSFRDQMTALELGKTDLVEVAPEQVARIPQERRRVASSDAVELIALIFNRDAATPEEKLLRKAVSLVVERGSIRTVMLQGSGTPTGAILPNWMSGYSFVFPSDADLPRAREARQQVRTIPTWTLGYDGSDPLARLLAERIALNAKDAGLSLQPTTAGSATMQLARIPLASPEPWIALADVARRVGMNVAKKQGGIEDLYAAEVALLATQRVIPLFHLPVSYASGTNVKNWSVRPDGTCTFGDAWLGTNP